MAMNRSEGLVQRRNVAQAAAASNKGGEDEGSDRDERGGGAGAEDDDHDSKETRLTLMEEVLLLGLKDREVDAWSLIYSVAAAISCAV